MWHHVQFSSWELKHLTVMSLYVGKRSCQSAERPLVAMKHYQVNILKWSDVPCSATSSSHLYSIERMKGLWHSSYQTAHFSHHLWSLYIMIEQSPSTGRWSDMYYCFIRDVYLSFFYDTIQYRYWQNETDKIRYDTKPLKIHFFPFGLLVYSAYSITVFRDHNFPNDVKMKNKTSIK